MYIYAYTYIYMYTYLGMYVYWYIYIYIYIYIHIRGTFIHYIRTHVRKIWSRLITGREALCLRRSDCLYFAFALFSCLLALPHSAFSWNLRMDFIKDPLEHFVPRLNHFSVVVESQFQPLRSKLIVREVGQWGTIWQVSGQRVDTGQVGRWAGGLAVA